MAIRKEKIIGKEDKEKKYKSTEELEEDLASTFKIESQKRLQYAKDCFRAASESRRRYDWEWLARDLFRRGYQFSRYNPANRTVILASRQVTRIPVNLTAAAMRVIRNQVTAFRPKWEVLPAHAGEEAIQNARYSEKILDWIWRKERLKKKVKETVMQGLIFSVGGPWQIGWDDNIISDDGTKGNLYIWNMDPYDFYIDPNCTDGLTFSDAEYVIKAVRKPLDEVKRNPLYKNTEQITTGEARVAASEYKQFLLQSLKYLGQYQQEENETVILKEGWFKERDEDGNVRMRVITWVDQMTDPLRDELTEETEFPFVQYQADINPLEVYGESWARHVIVINRVINALESSIFDYNYRYAKGRIVVDKNAGVRAITNEHGSIIEKNRGADVHSLPLQPLPPSVEGQANRMRVYFEDISGAHDVSLGRIPAGVKSGIGVAELKQADACVDTKTEALTRTGWKRFNELKAGDDIYTLNPKTKKGNWDKVKKVFYYKKDNVDLYSLENRNISALVTHDHSWFVKTAKSNWHLKKTTELRNDNYIPLAMACNPIPTQAIYKDDFVKLVAWTLTEGTYTKDKNWPIISIYQNRFVNPDNVKEIRKTLDNLGITRKEWQAPDGNNQYKFAKDFARQIRQEFPNKTLTFEFVNRLTREQLKILVDTLIKGDGSIRKDGRRSFITTDKETADAFQYACTLLGIATRLSRNEVNRNLGQGLKKYKDRYTVYLKKTKQVSFNSLLRHNGFRKVKYTGLVWCPQTNDGVWLARRNGITYFTGNTNQDDLVDNLEDFLVEVGKKVLKIVAQHFDTPRIIKITGVGGKTEYFSAIGEKWGKGRKREVTIGKEKYPLAVIAERNEIDVSIGSWLAASKESRQQLLRELYREGVIDKKTLLEHLEFGDIETIMERTRNEEILKAKRGAPGQTEPGVSEEELALSENEMMLEGRSDVQAQPQDDHQVHLAVHQEAIGKGQDDIVNNHIAQHKALLGGGTEVGAEGGAGIYG